MRKERTITKFVYTCDDCGCEIKEGSNYKCDKTGKDLCHNCKYIISVTLCREEYKKYDDNEEE